jgi:TonB family protein
VKILQSVLLALALEGAAAGALAADSTFTGKFEGDVGELPADTKTHLDICLGVAKQILPESTERTRVSVGIHVDGSGRIKDAAVVESSGIKELDDWMLGCFRDARFKPPARGAGNYRLVRTELARRPYEPPVQCAVGMHTDVTIGFRPLESLSAEDMPTGAEATVCGCLTDLTQGPTSPVILDTSGFPQVDQGAVALMKQTAAERWTTTFGCTAWKVRVDR